MTTAPTGRTGHDPLWRVIVHVDGNPDYVAEHRAPRAGLAETRAMASYPYPLRGALVTYTVAPITGTTTDPYLAIGCPFDDGLFATADEVEAHLDAVHRTTYDEATGVVLSQDECDAIGADGRDGRGLITLANLTDLERTALYAYRNR